jgi:hydroxyethylthiazole kinase-like uncharacterized protein yjeF
MAAMQPVTADRPWPLFDVAGLRRIEQAAAAQLPPHTLMQRAGLAVARLALAVAPHARGIWIACGPGNNGGDGLEAAMHLQAWGKRPVVTWLGSESKAPADALASLQRARQAGVVFSDAAPHSWDLGIDALLGIGAGRTPDGPLLAFINRLNSGAAPVLAVDIPSALVADTGTGEGVHAHWTLSLLGLKPGLFTAHGRDAAGAVWLDDLGTLAPPEHACAWLTGPPSAAPRSHAWHKGSYGDVAVLGGAAGMTGAALLAASAALHHGAGRVFLGLLDDAGMAVDAGQPELMFRPWDSLDLAAMTVACGCGGGDAVRGALPKVLSNAKALVLDADGLNAIAADAQLQTLLQARGRRQDRQTVLTPHPLEAARLLGRKTGEIQSNRLGAARELAQRFHCTVVLKGSGSIVCMPQRPAAINPTGNGRLATAGTGDVLAGMVAARLARGDHAFEAACASAYDHGLAADLWPADRPLTASALARAEQNA